MKKKNPAPGSAPDPTEAEIQHQAYHLWIDGGCLEGVELDNWFAARELLRHRHGRSSAPKPRTEAPRSHRALETN